MGCIEISIDISDRPEVQGLIETWDVLKCQRLQIYRRWISSLIETWDVLKFLVLCKGSPSIASLIETWDVLK